jgi:hypothetical protein
MDRYRDRLFVLNFPGIWSDREQRSRVSERAWPLASGGQQVRNSRG